MNQYVLDEAVKIATRCAMNGTPVQRILWVQPSSAASDQIGTFMIFYDEGNISASQTPKWMMN